MDKVLSMNDKSLWDMETDKERDEYCKKHIGISYNELLKEWDENPIYKQEYQNALKALGLNDK